MGNEILRFPVLVIKTNVYLWKANLQMGRSRVLVALKVEGFSFAILGLENVLGHPKDRLLFEQKMGNEKGGRKKIRRKRKDFAREK